MDHRGGWVLFSLNIAVNLYVDSWTYHIVCSDQWLR